MSGDPLKQRSLTNGQVISLVIFVVTILTTGCGLFFGLKQVIRDEIANSYLNYRLLEQRVALLERMNKIALLTPAPEPMQYPIDKNLKYKPSEAIFPKVFEEKETEKPKTTI